ncbi:MAG TPA: phage portal protein [Polyangia bacterium]|nr:phage portal protein [Polyangia bacterium]
MASAMHRDPAAGERITNTVAQQELVQEQMRRVGLSQRQVELNRLFSYARAAQHDACAIDWDGSPHPTAVDREGIVSSSFLPQGWKDPGGNLSPLPLRYRRPSVPCHLGKVIPARFTSLLFSEAQHPQWKAPGFPETEAWVEAVSTTYDLWSKMELVRDMGGGMGTAIFGFKIIKGRVMFEAFDARWCFPTFDPEDPGQLQMLEVRYMFPQETLDTFTGKWREDKFWYRRIIDTKVDCLWRPQLVGDGSQEPNWKDPTTVASMVEHGFSFVPVEWVQNVEVIGDIDGDPDCHGCYDHFDRIGELDSQCHKGAVRNADPTVTISSDGAIPAFNAGSDEALKLEKGGTASFLETQGSAVKAASEESDRLRGKALEIAECVMPEQDDHEGGPITATEMVKKTSAMYAKASRMRQQYGRAIVSLMGKLVRATQSLSKATTVGDQIVRQTVLLPPKMDGEKRGAYQLDQEPDVQLKLEWPPFSEPTPADTLATATATNVLVLGGIITKRTATRKVAPHFNIEDVDAEVAQAAKEKPATQDFGMQSLNELQQGR